MLRVARTVLIQQRQIQVQADLQHRQIRDILKFPSDLGQLFLQLLLVAVQLQQLGGESGWVFPGWSVGCCCSVQVHKQLLIALHLLIQLLYVQVLSNIRRQLHFSNQTELCGLPR